ncbi:sulfurtransferase [Flavobacterium silvaticum]|uniref:Sulfurtransferase n=1 Tax=Flavobacterium silvaticum TaxID=1852020 RepID=A0A972FN92_9FLAO|nr:sulfurtransferase [Flavobacterium silvaticum]NMH28817.1 sulfurtransferase [Flavobacterium silvaticum]
MTPLITPDELLLLYKNDDVILVDVSNSSDAFENYKRSHLEKAVFVDVNKDLATVGDPKFGGRHPLPSIKHFLKAISNIGISERSHVVIYDNHCGANAAARLWWMLRAIGHTKVQVLDGGFQNAIAKGFPTTDHINKSTPSKDYESSGWNLPFVTIDAVRKAIHEKSHLLIDVREKQRYDGITEPIDLVAGHIPTAVNIPFRSNLDEAGNFRKPEDLRDLYRNMIGDKKSPEVIVYCGSGVTACHTLLAFEVAGLPVPNLYVGSWSEWSRNHPPSPG